jgi:hypothetical protein
LRSLFAFVFAFAFAFRFLPFRLFIRLFFFWGQVDVFAPQDVVQRGWLWKRGALNKGFKRRWFVLTCGGELFYYKSDRHSRCQNFIPLLDSVVKVCPYQRWCVACRVVRCVGSCAMCVRC